MRVLVTGADGYIGSVLVADLLERGFAVRGLDAGFYRDGRLYDDERPRPPVEGRDIRDLGPGDLAGLDAVVHLGELSNDPLGELDPALTRAVNHRGSLRLAEACKAAGVPRFVYASSCSVYGAAEGDRDETSPTAPLTAYAACKLLVERDVGALADRCFSPVFLRNATAFGVSPRMRFDLVLNNLAGLAWTTGTVAMSSDGTPWRPLVHVADICQAVALALEAPRESIHNEILNVGDDGQNYRVREIAGIIAGVFPGCRTSFGPPRGDQRSYRVSFARIARHLPGFRCRWSAERGARELRHLFERIALSPAIFGFRAFTRLEQLRHLLATGRLDAALRWRDGAPAGAADPAASA
ncbi:MAG: SDR family oxidoreductase [Dongiaceae bacterium]